MILFLFFSFWEGRIDKTKKKVRDTSNQSVSNNSNVTAATGKAKGREGGNFKRGKSGTILFQELVFSFSCLCMIFSRLSVYSYINEAGLAKDKKKTKENSQELSL